MEKLIKNPTIGADIELFLKNTDTNEIVSAEGFIQGTKDKPFVFDESNKYFATSLDNVLAEFCIPPSDNKVDFYNYIQKCVNYIKGSIPKELTVEALPAAILNEKYLQTEQAKIFGCEPDYCVWTKSCNEKPYMSNGNLRSAGGHIHVGYEDPNMKINEQIVMALDLYLGVPSVLQEPENERKQLYGKAGAFRWKDYGVEYRTISNYYLKSKELTDWVFQNTMSAIEAINNGTKFEMLKHDILNAINNNNKKVAEVLIKSFNIKLAA